jgi:hypothetical protein
MKYRIEAQRKVFLSIVIEAESETAAREAALGAPYDVWNADLDEETEITFTAQAGAEVEAPWRATADWEIEPNDEPAERGAA